MVLKVFFMSLFMSLFAFANTQNVDKLDMLMQNAKMCDNLMNIKDLLVEQESDKIKAEGFTRLNSVLECSNLERKYKKIAYSYLNDGDLDSLNEFYASPLGEKFVMVGTNSYKMESSNSLSNSTPQRQEKIKVLLQALGMDKMIVTIIDLKLDFDQRFEKESKPQDAGLREFLHKFMGSFVAPSFERELSGFSDNEIDQLVLFYSKNQSAKNEVLLDGFFLEQLAKELVQ